MGLLQNGLLGMGGAGALGGITPPAGLLGPAYDPQQMKQLMLKRGLIGTGLGLMRTGKIGDAFAGGIEGADAARTGYMQDAQTMAQLDAQNRSQQAVAEQEQKVQAWLNTLSPQDQAMAEAFPDKYAEQFLQSKFSASASPAKPAGIQEYEYAKEQGFPGTFQDWEASKKGGMRIDVDPVTGAMTFQQGTNIKPMTESQSKDTVYATRAEGALRVFDQIESGMTGAQGAVGQSVGQIPLVGNYMKSGDFQAAEQAGNEFLQAVLRKDTGAAITEGEQALYGNTYLPRAGDAPEVLAQKKAARARALAAIKAGMTPQAILAQEKALSGQQAPSADGWTVEEVP